MTHAAERQKLTDAFIAHAAEIAAEGPMGHERLDRIKTRLMDIAARAELWGEDDFPDPSMEDKQNRFLSQINPAA